MYLLSLKLIAIQAPMLLPRPVVHNVASSLERYREWETIACGGATGRTFVPAAVGPDGIFCLLPVLYPVPCTYNL